MPVLSEGEGECSDEAPAGDPNDGMPGAGLADAEVDEASSRRSMSSRAAEEEEEKEEEAPEETEVGDAASRSAAKDSS